ncbi:hypothetical protein D9M71_495950 [compost metagenome]
MELPAEPARQPDRARVVLRRAHEAADRYAAGQLAGVRRTLQDPVDRTGRPGAGQRQRLVRPGHQDPAFRRRHPVSAGSRDRNREDDRAVAFRPGQPEHAPRLHRRLRLQGPQHFRLLRSPRSVVRRRCTGTPGQRPLRAVPEWHQASPVRHSLPIGGGQERPQLQDFPLRDERRRWRTNQLQPVGGCGGRHGRTVDLLHAAERSAGHGLSLPRR